MNEVVDVKEGMMKDPFDVKGKSVIVTGGAMGIGRGIASRFVERGANVLITDLDGEAAAVAAKSVEGPGRAVAMAVDVALDGAGEAMVARCVEEFGSVDVLVNNAGIYPMAPMLQTTPEMFDRVYQVNLRGTAFAAKAAAARMIEQSAGGAIINIASIDALHPSMVGLPAYDASKGGVLMLTKSLALELAPHGIRVNAIAPGGIATEGTSAPLQGSGMTEAEMDAMIAGFTAKIPLGRIGQPDDIATAAVFLASEAAAYIAGDILVVDGGRLLS
jgi:2-deoxy-D-gluconate 3-dehydrogenase